MVSVTAMPMRHVEHCMGTVFSFDVRSPGVAPEAISNAVAWLHHVDEIFSTYRPDSVISRLRNGELELRQLSAEVVAVLGACAELTRGTDGYFSAYYSGELDPSGYVKGWAIEKASDILVAAGSRNHCVNGGGDVQCVGEAACGRPWRIGIADPHTLGRLLCTVQGSQRFAVATSGNTERGQHILDPHTQTPPHSLAAVTVVGTGLTGVDAYATAAFSMGADAASWLAGRPDLSCIVVHADGRLVRTGTAAALGGDPAIAFVADE